MIYLRGFFNLPLMELNSSGRLINHMQRWEIYHNIEKQREGKMKKYRIRIILQFAFYLRFLWP